jgi:elongator complex protein 5
MINVSFSPSLLHLIARPSALICHIADQYLVTPPLTQDDEEIEFVKYLGVYLPISEREYEAEQVVFGPGGEGSGNSDDFIVEALAREI